VRATLSVVTKMGEARLTVLPSLVTRTGAGKSSLLQALFRTVELTSGTIQIDGEDCRQVDLPTLRSRMGIVPQDPFLWNGTVRANLDPAGLRTDAELNDSLRRCHLAARPEQGVELKARLDKFRLDAVVQDEGANFSAGERQVRLRLCFVCCIKRRV
jgi:ATP-binding cassette subfamily C (CFTR/MRP) protein 1